MAQDEQYIQAQDLPTGTRVRREGVSSTNPDGDIITIDRPGPTPREAHLRPINHQNRVYLVDESKLTAPEGASNSYTYRDYPDAGLPHIANLNGTNNTFDITNDIAAISSTSISGHRNRLIADRGVQIVNIRDARDIHVETGRGDDIVEVRLNDITDSYMSANGVQNTTIDMGRGDGDTIILSGHLSGRIYIRSNADGSITLLRPHYQEISRNGENSTVREVGEKIEIATFRNAEFIDVQYDAVPRTVNGKIEEEAITATRSIRNLIEAEYLEISPSGVIAVIDVPAPSAPTPDEPARPSLTQRT